MSLSLIRSFKIDNPKYRGLRGCDRGTSGPIKYIVKRGQPIGEDLDTFAAVITRDQELAEADYMQGVPESLWRLVQSA